MNSMPTYRQGRRRYRPGPADRGGCAGIFSVLLVLLFLGIPPLILIVSETHRHDIYEALASALDSGIKPLDARIRPGDMVHGTTDRISSLATDRRMGVSIPGALALRRRTEYCQWQELKSENCRTCTRTVKARDGSTQQESYQCDCVTSYSYVKSWRSHRINSMLFDQPAAHNNPQRDPMPPATFPASDVTIAVADAEEGRDVKASLDQSMLTNVRANYRPVNWVPGGVPPTPRFFARFLSWIPNKTRYEPVADLRGAERSAAAREDNFVYVGQGGYFFSPYQESRTAMMFKYFMQYVEGSLLDWQLGDLMPSCTAGDVRFYYEVADPAVISVLGQAEPNIARSSRADISLRAREMENGVVLGLVHAGKHSAEGMIETEDAASRWKAMVPRVLFALWTAAFSRLVGALFRRDIGGSGLATQLAAMSALSCATVGSIWMVLWGVSVDTVFMLVGALALAMVTARYAQPSKGSQGFRAVWCMIGRWAGVPPSWRMEDSYLEDKRARDSYVYSGTKGKLR